MQKSVHRLRRIGFHPLVLTLPALVYCTSGENDPLKDDDGDGYSEQQGDCDDENPDLVHFCGVRIEPGTFLMGCSDGQLICNDDEVPAHEVTLTQPYEIGQTEVTQAQFLDLMGFNPSVISRCGPDCPVEYATWHEAAQMANVLSDQAGLENCFQCQGSTCTTVENPYDCQGYRLPTEAEWEFAARCGEDTLFSGSDRPDEVAWTSNNSRYTTHPVGQLMPNACGLYDMSGNVWEWVWDIYAEDYYAHSPSTDPHGPSEGEYRVYRGGGFANESGDSRVSDRCSSCHPVDIVNSVGFRIARGL